MSIIDIDHPLSRDEARCVVNSDLLTNGDLPWKYVA